MTLAEPGKSKKKVRAPPGSGSKLGPRDLLVCPHRHVSIEGQVGIHIMPELDGPITDPLMVLQGLGRLGRFEDIEHQLMMWSRASGGVKYCMPGNGENDDHVREVCTILMESNAVPNAAASSTRERQSWTDEQIQALKWMRSQGFVDGSSEDPRRSLKQVDVMQSAFSRLLARCIE